MKCPGCGRKASVNRTLRDTGGVKRRKTIATYYHFPLAGGRYPAPDEELDTCDVVYPWVDGVMPKEAELGFHSRRRR